MCVHVCVHKCMCTDMLEPVFLWECGHADMYAHVCTCVWRPEVVVRCLLLSFPFLFFETESLTEPAAYLLARLAGQ